MGSRAESANAAASARDEAHPAHYRVAKLYDEHGNVAPHFVGEEFHALFSSWEEALAHPHFASIIDMDDRAERCADGPLDHLAQLAPNERVGSFFLDWLAFIDADLDPWTTGGAIHFRPHWARVLMLALSIGDAMGLPDADLRCLAMAAAFHDSRRKSPYLDKGHGARAAQYCFEFGRQTDGRKTAAGRAFRTDPRTLLAIKWHDRNDEEGFEAIARACSGAEVLDPDFCDGPMAIPDGASADPAMIYRIFKDSDGLDRIRLGESGLDVRYLRTDCARGMLDFARALLAACW